MSEPSGVHGTVKTGDLTDQHVGQQLWYANQWRTIDEIVAGKWGTPVAVKCGPMWLPYDDRTDIELRDDPRD